MGPAGTPVARASPAWLTSWQPVRTSVLLGATEQHASQLPALAANTSGSSLPALSEGVPAPLPSSGTLFLPPSPILPAGDQMPMSPALKKCLPLSWGLSKYPSPPWDLSVPTHHALDLRDSKAHSEPCLPSLPFSVSPGSLAPPKPRTVLSPSQLPGCRLCSPLTQGGHIYPPYSLTTHAGDFSTTSLLPRVLRRAARPGMLFFCQRSLVLLEA